MSTPARPAALLTLALAIAVLAPSAKGASAPDPLASSSTTLTLSASFKRLLSAHGVSLSATAPATRKAFTYTLPLAEGHVDPTASGLSLENEGSLSLSRGPRRVIIRHLSVKTAPAPLIAKVGGGQLKIATSAKRSFARKGFGSSFRANGLRLTAKVATRLDKKLHLTGVFQPGQRFANLRVSAQPATVAILPEGRLTLTPDPTFLAKLDSLFVSLNPVAPANASRGRSSAPPSFRRARSPPMPPAACHAAAARSNSCSSAPARSSGTNSGSTSPATRSSPKSTSSRPDLPRQTRPASDPHSRRRRGLL